ncbi:MAG: hypothetical protein V4538_01585 [Bacteroidota bacterium]
MGAKKVKTVNSISGGKTSAYIAVHYPADYEVFSVVCIDDKECTPTDKALIDYANNKLAPFHAEYGDFIATAELDETLIAMMDLEQYLGREIIWVRGKSFDKILTTANTHGGAPNRLPSWARRYCTDEMKLVPIFKWWLNNVGEKVNMRIGFRFDEFDRMERFFNNSDPCNFKIATSCSLRGQRQQKHTNFNWRFCHFPLVKAGITETIVKDYWANNGWLTPNLFNTNSHQINFPPISNCVGCFHKKVETLSIMSHIAPAKMRWFAFKETLGKGTWLDSQITYAEIIENNKDWIPEMLSESLSHCDSGGCHD